MYARNYRPGLMWQPAYRIAGNACGNLIVHFAVETKNAQFYSAQYYFHAICVGVIRRGGNCHVSTCTEAQRGMALFRGTCLTIASPLITATAYGSSSSSHYGSSSWSVGFHVAFTDMVSSRTAVDHHRLHRHMVSDCVGVRYYMYVYTSAIITICGCARYGTFPKCKISFRKQKSLDFSVESQNIIPTYITSVTVIWYPQ